MAGLGALGGSKRSCHCAHAVNAALGERDIEGNRNPLSGSNPAVPTARGCPGSQGDRRTWAPPPPVAAASGDVAGLILNEDARLNALSCQVRAGAWYAW